MAFDRDTDPSMPWIDWSRIDVWESGPRSHHEIRNIERPWDWNRTLLSTVNRQLSAKLSWGVVNLKLKNTKPWSKHLFFVLTVQWSSKCGNKTEVSVDVCVCAHTCVHTWVKRSEEGIKWPLTVGSPSEPGAHDFSEDGSRWAPTILSLPLSGLGLQACMGPRLTFHTGAWSKHSTSVLSHQA